MRTWVLRVQFDRPLEGSLGIGEMVGEQLCFAEVVPDVCVFRIEFCGPPKIRDRVFLLARFAQRVSEFVNDFRVFARTLQFGFVFGDCFLVVS